MSDEDFKPELTQQAQIVPAYEYVKQNILARWFDIQKEYMKFKRISGTNKGYQTQGLSSEILSLYITMLRPIMLNNEEYKDKVAEFDKFETENDIPSDKISESIKIISSFLHSIKLTDVSFKKLPFGDQFANSYGI